MIKKQTKVKKLNMDQAEKNFRVRCQKERVTTTKEDDFPNKVYLVIHTFSSTPHNPIVSVFTNEDAAYDMHNQLKRSFKNKLSSISIKLQCVMSRWDNK